MALTLAPTVADVWRRHPYARLAVTVLASYDVVFGFVLALSDPARTSSASFVTIRETGGPIVWGAGLVLVGVATGAAALVSRRALAWSLLIAGAAHLFLTSGFVVAYLDRPDAAATGIPTYTAIAAIHAVQCVLHRRPAPPTP